MKQEIKDYIKCAYANKATLAGFISLPLSIAAGIAGKQLELDHPMIQSVAYLTSSILFMGGLYLLHETLYGFDTLEKYQKTKKHILKVGAINQHYSKIHNLFYCSRAGIRLAAKEAGLEATLENLK